MSGAASPPPAPPADSTPVALLTWRVDELARRVEAMDHGGTRGVQLLTQRVDQLVNDVASHKAAHTAAEEHRRTDRRWIIGTAVGLITPLYPLIGWVMTHART